MDRFRSEFAAPYSVPNDVTWAIAVNCTSRIGFAVKLHASSSKLVTQNPQLNRVRRHQKKEEGCAQLPSRRKPQAQNDDSFVNCGTYFWGRLVRLRRLSLLRTNLPLCMASHSGILK